MITILVWCYVAFLVLGGKHRGCDQLVNAFDLVSPVSRHAARKPSGFKLGHGSSLLCTTSLDLAQDLEPELLIERLSVNEKLLDLQNKELIRLEGELSDYQANHGPVVDLRPILQKSVTDWYLKRYRPTGKLVTADAFNAFFNLLKSSDSADINDQYRLEYLIDLAVSDGQADGAVRENVEQMLENIWSILSEDNVFKTDEASSCDEFWFVVSGSGDFAAAASVMLRFFQIRHTVMSPGYQNARYCCYGGAESQEIDWVVAPDIDEYDPWGDENEDS